VKARLAEMGAARGSVISEENRRRHREWAVIRAAHQAGVIATFHKSRSAYDFNQAEGAIVTKFPRRQFLHLAAGAAALPAVWSAW
jgi:hypothetical protein